MKRTPFPLLCRRQFLSLALRPFTWACPLGGGGTNPVTSIGVYIRNASGSSKSGVTVNNCDVSNFAGDIYAQTAEIFVSGYYGTLNTIKITNNQLHGANGVASKDNNGIYGF